jgi:hypothetical protein
MTCLKRNSEAVAESETVPLTMYVIADLDSAKGIALMSNALAAAVRQFNRRDEPTHTEIAA